MSTHILLNGEITAYTRISIKQLKHAIHTEQSHNSVIQRVQQRLAISLKNRNNLTESEMTNMMFNKTNMVSDKTNIHSQETITTIMSSI